MSATPLQLRRIEGPSALGGGARRFLHLTWLVATTDYKLTYFGSALGYLWSFTQPLLFFGVLYLVVVLVFMLIYGIEPRVTWLLLPVIALAFFVFTAGVSMLLSALYVRYRDVSPIWGVISQALFYASPVFITIEAIEQHGHTLARYYLFNPLGAILQQARHWMLGDSPGTPAVMGGYEWAVIPLLIGLGICALGYWTFKREAPRIAEEL